jgi:hypothetical protein
MASAVRPKVSFQTAPSPRAIPWSPEDERRITDLVRESLDGTPGSWEVTLVFSGVLAHTWIVEYQRTEDGRELRMLVDFRRDEDRSALLAAIRSLDTRRQRRPHDPHQATAEGARPRQ